MIGFLVSTRRAAPVSAGALVLALGLMAGVARPFSVSLVSGTSGPLVHWPRTTIGFYLHPSCSTDVPTATCLSEVRASFAAWTASCSGAVFTDLGTSTNLQLTAVGGAANGKNEVAWIETSVWTYGTYVLGVTAPIFQTDGTIVEADIAMNGYSQTWSTNGTDYSTDVRSVAVHEIGHLFGLQHNLGGYDPADPPTMEPTEDPYMRSRTPNADDLRGLCFLLPKDPYHCASTAECPTVVADGSSGEYYAGQLQCSNTTCGGMGTAPSGSGQLGAACASDVDCSGTLFCQPWSGTAGICTHTCKPTQSNCETGYSCKTYSSAPNKGVCLPNETGGGTVVDGQPCTASSDCVSNLCVSETLGRVCREPCSTAAPCAAGSECQLFVGMAEGACVPLATTKPNGEICQGPAECTSGMCASIGFEYTCVAPCASDSDCPGGYLCALFEPGVGGCFPGGAGLAGDPCRSGWDCSYGLCYSFDGGSAMCSEPCATTADCPCGWECGPSPSDGNVCFPGSRVACVADGESCGQGSECTGGYCVAGSCASGCQTTFDGCIVCAGWVGSGDADADGVADRCDRCPGHDDGANADHDVWADGCDNCPLVAQADQADADHDGVGDACDRCPGAPDSADADHDGVPDACDRCAGFADGIDGDHDGIADGCDDCPGVANAAQADGDHDGVGDACDRCPGADDRLDDDHDGIPNGCEGCATARGPGCDDGDPCTVDTCSGGTCVYTAYTGECDDGDGCTIGDVCANGACHGVARGCDDGNDCTLDACAHGACTHAPVATGSCSDGDPCTLGDYCLVGVCLTLGVMQCDPGEVCADDGHGEPICVGSAPDAAAEEATAAETTTAEESIAAETTGAAEETTVETTAAAEETTAETTAGAEETTAPDTAAVTVETTAGAEETTADSASPEPAPSDTFDPGTALAEPAPDRAIAEGETHAGRSDGGCAGGGGPASALLGAVLVWAFRRRPA